LAQANALGRWHAAAAAMAVGKARKPLSSGELGKPGNVDPGDSYQRTTLL